jgi:hypothetical protein
MVKTNDFKLDAVNRGGKWPGQVRVIYVDSLE